MKKCFLSVLALGVSLSFMLGNAVSELRADDSNAGTAKGSILASSEEGNESVSESARTWTLENNLKIYGTWDPSTDIYEDMVVLYLHDYSVFVPVTMEMLSAKDLDYIVNVRSENTQNVQGASEKLSNMKWINFDWDWVEEDGSNQVFLSVTFAGDGEILYYYPSNFRKDIPQIRKEVGSLYRVWTLQDGKCLVAKWSRDCKIYTERRSQKQYLHLSNLSGGEARVYLSNLSEADSNFVENVKNLLTEMTNEMQNAPSVYSQQGAQRYQEQQYQEPQYQQETQQTVPVRQDRPVLREAWRRGSPYIPYF